MHIPVQLRSFCKHHHNNQTERPYYSDGFSPAVLQSLTKAALDEEEADRTAAVQDVVAALSMNTETESLQSLRSEVDSLVEDLRLEVAAGAGAQQGLEIEQVVQVCPLTILFGPV